MGGRVLTVSLDDGAETDFKTLVWKGARLPDSKIDSRVDIGASVMVGCGDSSQFVLRRALKDKIRAPICAGGHVYESTTYAVWYDRTRRVPPRLIAEAHAVHNLAQHNVAISARTIDNLGASLDPAWLNDFRMSLIDQPLMKKNETFAELLTRLPSGTRGAVLPWLI